MNCCHCNENIAVFFSKRLMDIISAIPGILVPSDQYIRTCGNLMTDISSKIPKYCSISFSSTFSDFPVHCTEYKLV